MYSRLQQNREKKLLGCETCSAATDVGMLGKMCECVCTLLNSVVAAIVPSCLYALSACMLAIHLKSFYWLI